ncbi:hypothetical protein CKF54_00580 [Psittacicella hinzii]|uniref:DNA-binding protein n=1 Tax=Psittacicella hinzii TaxID=2028575 RepID=A0A3A1YAQ6_9GAMM|nr:HU family DNA-binding protein [Psittacicella hinzii]RIY34426.1 hypothetical protein CKF54_00580 [Psittacicella hinzii]
MSNKNNKEAVNPFKSVKVNELLTNTQFFDLFVSNLNASKNEEVATLSKVAAKEAYSALVSTLSQALSLGRKVRVKDLGTFSTRYRPARTFRSPRDNNMKIESPETVSVHFSLATNLKSQVQENKELIAAHAKLYKEEKK